MNNTLQPERERDSWLISRCQVGEVQAFGVLVEKYKQRAYYTALGLVGAHEDALVKGNAVRARHIGKDLLAVFKNIIGGEIEEYTKLLAESRDQSIDRMVVEAERLGANPVVEVRFSTSYIMASAAEILVYGTAVVVE